METFLLLLSPFAPHLTEELWQKMGHSKSISGHEWPIYDPTLVAEEVLEIPVMVNGKVKSRITVTAGAAEEAVEKEAMKDAKVLSALEGKKILQKKYVPGKIFTLAVS